MAKVEGFVLRFQCKWDLKIREYLERGVAPPIHQANLCAPFRDSGREIEVWMMSCLIRHFRAEMESKYEPELVKKFVLQWRSGNLDSKLIPEAFAQRPT